MNNFQIGDEVICLENVNSSLSLNKKYTVLESGNNSDDVPCIKVKEKLGSWFSNRFKLAKEKTSLDKEIDELKSIGYRNEDSNDLPF